MSKAVYPGSFDPVTFGHLDIIKRSACIVDKLYVGVLDNSAKKPAFSVVERVGFIKELTKDIPNVECVSFSGLLVDFAKKFDAKVVIRGLRAAPDFEYEFQMALTNKNLYPELETIFIPTNLNHLFVNSSMVKEVASYGGDINGLVPDLVKEALEERFKNGRI